MDAPFGILFLKKAELYNLVCRLDKQYKNDDEKSSPWSVEKQILRWTYQHHKHLGSPIDTNHLSSGSNWNELKDFGMLDKKGELKKRFKYLEKGHLSKPLENLVVRGFASYFDESQAGHNAIVINKDGLLVGEVLADLEQQNLVKKLNYLFYSNIMDHFGASLLIILTVLGVLKLLDIF